MRVRQTEAGREQFGVWRKGKHDDLVLATALACWAVKKVRPAGAWGEPEYVVNRDEREWARRFQWEIDRVMRRVGAGR
ncbi:MAG: hypothetical protein NTY38_09080, partial [Acidobacteria bacterium]|nr:hypothetical protein [Acidobacteriota bacterium]